MFWSFSWDLLTTGALPASFLKQYRPLSRVCTVLLPVIRRKRSRTIYYLFLRLTRCRGYPIPLTAPKVLRRLHVQQVKYLNIKLCLYLRKGALSRAHPVWLSAGLAAGSGGFHPATSLIGRACVWDSYPSLSNNVQQLEIWVGVVWACASVCPASGRRPIHHNSVFLQKWIWSLIKL